MRKIASINRQELSTLLTALEVLMEDYGYRIETEKERIEQYELLHSRAEALYNKLVDRGISDIRVEEVNP